MINCPICKREYKGFGKVCKSCSKKGDANPAKKIEVRDRISDSIKKQYEIHKKQNIPYGFKVGEENWISDHKAELHPNWKGGITNENEINKQCFEEYGKKCFICDKNETKIKHSNIYIHHLNHIHNDHRIENIIPVCDSCHQKLHRWWKGWILDIQDDIDYGHHLPNHDGKCFFSHGHTAIIRLKVEGLIREDGMVIDFKYLKQLLKDSIEPLDHSYLNTLEENPSSEKLTSFIFHQIEINLYKIRKEQRRIVWMKQLEVSEGLNKSIIIDYK